MTSNNDFEEEEVCRVCHGPSEESQPLYHPCKCSGSIKFVHQVFNYHNNEIKCGQLRFLSTRSALQSGFESRDQARGVANFAERTSYSHPCTNRYCFYFHSSSSNIYTLFIFNSII